ncbi:MAG TPA: hypothetical protein VEC14_07335 [Reyranellaceae bacterium]|nr:hypothetical protein [Reyranellaceae bacterium]
MASSQPGFGDDGRQDSGIKQFVPGGALIDAGARARYNGLVEIYGKAFSPRLREDYGIERRGDLFFITNDALERFIVMSDWRKMGRPPP